MPTRAEHRRAMRARGKRFDYAISGHDLDLGGASSRAQRRQSAKAQRLDNQGHAKVFQADPAAVRHASARRIIAKTQADIASATAIARESFGVDLIAD